MSPVVTVEVPYTPMPKQGAFHELSAKYRGFCGGWGNGKTSAGCAETFISLHEYPKTTAIVSRLTRPELKTTTWEMMMYGDGSDTGWTGIPKEVVAVYNRSDLYLEFRNGSKIHGLPLDSPQKLENYNLGWFWIDQAEEVPEDIFLKFIGRLRQRVGPREGIVTFNPNGHNYLWKRFIDPDRPSVWQDLFKCVEATPFENPNLPTDYLEQFQALPKAWYDRFVSGSHEVFVGQIFTDWDPDVHVVEDFRIPPHWERWSCMDPGIRHEGCVSWMARDPMEGPNGPIFYYREILAPNQTVRWWANSIFEAEEAYDNGGPNETITRRLIGPEAQQRSQTDGKSVLDLFSECGIYCELADRDPLARISKITELLRRHDGTVHPGDGTAPAPRVYVFASCRKLQEYLPQYRWRPQRTNFTEEEAAEKPRKKDDHNIDNLGHILLGMAQSPPVESDMVDNSERDWLDEHFLEAVAAGENVAAAGFYGIEDW